MIQRHTPRLMVMWITNSSQNSRPLLATTVDTQIIVGKVTFAIASILIQSTADILMSYGLKKYCCSKQRSLN